MGKRAQPDETTSFSLKVGNWLEARATGWAVALMPLIVALVIGVLGLAWVAGPHAG